MRSTILKTTLAAILVSSGIAGAYAASAPSGTVSRFDPPQAEAVYGDIQHSPELAPELAPDMTTTASVTPAAASQERMAHRPRLAMILREIGRANHRIAMEHRHGLLTRAEYRSLSRDAMHLRREAMMTARRHDGRIPNARYSWLQEQVRMLNRDIHRAA